MIATFTAEWRKLIRRPALWWLGGLLLAMIVLFYAFSWIQFTSSSFQPEKGISLAELKAGLYPANFARQIVERLGFPLGSALTLIIGALVVGGEYGWATLKTVYTQRPGRLQVLGGQFSAISAMNAVLVLLLFVIGAASSSVIVTLDGQAAVWPATSDMLKAAGATWFIFECWTFFGMAMSYLFKQSATAIGLGLAYMLAIEGILFRALRGLNLDWLTTVEKFFMGQNAGALAASFGQIVHAPGPAGPAPLVSVEQALMVLALYAVGFIAIAAALVRIRDVT